MPDEIIDEKVSLVSDKTQTDVAVKDISGKVLKGVYNGCNFMTATWDDKTVFSAMFIKCRFPTIMIKPVDLIKRDKGTVKDCVYREKQEPGPPPPPPEEHDGVLNTPEKPPPQVILDGSLYAYLGSKEKMING